MCLKLIDMELQMSRSCRMIVKLFVILALAVGPSLQNDVYKYDAEHKLLKALFMNYSKDARPVLNKSEAVDVQFDLAYAQLINLNSKDQILQSKVWLRQMWTNPFLTWNPKDYGGIDSINVDPDLIWKPDIVLYNNIGFGETGAIYTFDTKATVEYNGYTAWFAPTEIHSICQIDITFFPFDEQFCKLQFGSWTYAGNQLNVTNKRDTADLTKYTISGEWEMVAMPIKRNVVQYSCCPVPYIDITFTIHIRRKVLYYMTNLIAPCIVLSVLTVFSFHLPPESGERIGLVITILLGLTVFMLVFTENVPRTSEVIPLIGKYAAAVLCVVSGSLVVTCCILRVFNKDPNRKMSKWFRKLIFNILGPLMMMKPPEVDSSVPRKDNQDAMICLTKGNGTPYDAHRKNKFEANLDKLTIPLVPPKRAGSNHVYSGATAHASKHTAQEASDDKMDELLYHARTMIEHLKMTTTTKAREGEWRFAAAVLDSVFFWLTFLVIAGSIIGFYLMIPRKI